MKKIIFLALSILMVVGCEELAYERLDIINGTKYIVTKKKKDANDYICDYRLIKVGGDKGYDYSYRDTTDYNVGDTLVLTIKKK